MCDKSCLNCTGKTKFDCIGCSQQYLSINKEVVLLNGSKICAGDCSDYGSLAHTSNGSVCCETGTYFNKSLQKCAFCDKSCEECAEEADQCYTCASDYYMFNSNKCVTECPKGYFKQNMYNYKTCDKCVPNCLDCSDGTSCNQCMEGNYFDKIYRDCSHCYYGCKNCSGPSKYQCFDVLIDTNSSSNPTYGDDEVPNNSSNKPNYGDDDNIINRNSSDGLDQGNSTIDNPTNDKKGNGSGFMKVSSILLLGIFSFILIVI